MPLGQLYDTFVTESLRLRMYGELLAAASQEQGVRYWMYPNLSSPAEWTWPGLAIPYDRDLIAEAYDTIISDPEGTDGDGMSAKLQSDYLASQERAYRLRQSGPLRCVMHAAARRAGHGNPFGAFGRVEIYAQDLIVAGAKLNITLPLNFRL